ncbi:hypothetical protein EDF28_0685 [Curtobacterium sp. PhB137]|uniref:DUF6355 family natural product biosynthesis protein n=1 Tax=unclassified Curtobacterium TaxID=257496 RepID=UPI000F4E118C|nr:MULTISPECIES: DUF6355 family natural product biosynthesis protein [unclassified Curtobacterium]RPE84749.1 hypothetical protein EDF28_0685 [Curtobacterium sp. PhB137]
MKLWTKIGGTALAATMMLGGSLAVAGPANAASPCGFYPITTGNIGGGDDGHYEKGTYNNCKSDPVQITVKYTYTSKSLCLSAGETTLFANPDYGALTGASWTGKYC